MKVFVVWRGRGPLALAVAILPLASCAGLWEINPTVALVAATFSFMLGGYLCWYLGHRWNGGSGYHMLYWIPLEYWGWLYGVAGVVFGFLLITGAINRTLLK